MKLLLVLAAGASLLAATSAFAMDAPALGNSDINPKTRGGVVLPYAKMTPKERAIWRLRAEGMKLKDEDGGTLTQAHHDYLQTKLDAIQAGNF